MLRCSSRDLFQENKAAWGGAMEYLGPDAIEYIIIAYATRWFVVCGAVAICVAGIVLRR